MYVCVCMCVCVLPPSISGLMLFKKAGFDLIAVSLWVLSSHFSFLCVSVWYVPQMDHSCYAHYLIKVKCIVYCYMPIAISTIPCKVYTLNLSLARSLYNPSGCFNKHICMLSDKDFFPLRHSTNHERKYSP